MFSDRPLATQKVAMAMAVQQRPESNAEPAVLEFDLPLLLFRGMTAGVDGFDPPAPLIIGDDELAIGAPGTAHRVAGGGGTRQTVGSMRTLVVSICVPKLP